MKKIVLILFISLMGINIYAQKLEKVKGSKIVITTERAFDTIKGVELHKNLKIDVVKGLENKLVIFADDNLHDVVLTDISDGILDIDISNKITRKKKFELTLYLTNLSMVTLNDNSKLTNTEYFIENNIQVVLNDKAQGDLMFDAREINIQANNHSKGDLLLKGEKMNLNLADNAKLKVGVQSNDVKINSGSKATIEINGKSDHATIVAKKFTKIKASNFKIKDALIESDDNATLYINVLKNIEIREKGKSKIFLFGNAKIELIEFKDNASLFKR